MNELETLVYDLKLQKDVLFKSRRLLTKAADAGLTGTGHVGSYVCLGCFYVACTMCGERLQLDQLISQPLWTGLSIKKVIKSVDALIRRLGLRVCPKCGREAESEKFCKACGTWIPRSIVSLQELQKCATLVEGTRRNEDEREKIFFLHNKYDRR